MINFWLKIEYNSSDMCVKEYFVTKAVKFHKSCMLALTIFIFDNKKNIFRFYTFFNFNHEMLNDYILWCIKEHEDLICICGGFFKKYLKLFWESSFTCNHKLKRNDWVNACYD